MGLNGNDRLSLMALIRKLIQASRDHNIETTLTTIAAHDSYSKEMLARKADGWKTDKIRITKEDVSQLGDTVITADFHHKDMVTFLKEQYGNKECQGYFALQFKEERTEGGDRCYDDVHNCELWEQIEKRVRRDHPNPVATGRPPMLAALQLYSDKTLLNMKGVNSHPIRASLLNVSYGKRIKNLVDVGYFPKVEFPVGLNDVACRRIKLHVLSKCLTVLLEKLKRLSFTGIDILDPWGMQQKVFPFLFNYAVDHPEVMDLTCNKDGMEPCNLCHVPKDKLLQIQRAWSIKTEKEQRALLDKYWQLNNNTEGEKLCKDLSFHYAVVPSGLWGFAYGENSALGGSQQAFAYESMHADALGVFLYIIDFIPACLSQQSASSIRIVNERMRLMPRATDFNLPFCDSKYIPDH
ncbi:hypothetical protein CEUSTIGMA_g1768.t1 [Chlamydomonas eustigma]|uniref:Uncharacterized protein n=1 Tax=Chlamydomonas eustigma TaxID=1157962 RepID=A0A250WUC5_9CHLO|nr:hypothetical protein CEUSTIGMA_g1768.t1 [Chlamydomonas eustigma]|eukprot:GAX74319.1 hypothetical protein CEUSTIGMA_g1768.t1 [Chlamydomonas eustigma]